MLEIKSKEKKKKKTGWNVYAQHGRASGQLLKGGTTANIVQSERGGDTGQSPTRGLGSVLTLHTQYIF